MYHLMAFSPVKPPRTLTIIPIYTILVVCFWLKEDGSHVPIHFLWSRLKNRISPIYILLAVSIHSSLSLIMRTWSALPSNIAQIFTSK